MHAMMSYVEPTFEFIARIVDVFGLSLLALGFLRGGLGWIRMEIQRGSWERRMPTIQKLRCVVGIHILYALELMIVSDIIESFLAVAAHSGTEATSSRAPRSTHWSNWR